MKQGRDPYANIFKPDPLPIPQQHQQLQAPTPQITSPQFSSSLDKIPSPGIEQKKATLAEINFLSAKTGHNPVYSPMPFNIQNPYILKQLQAAYRGQANLQQNRSPGVSPIV